MKHTIENPVQVPLQISTTIKGGPAGKPVVEIVLTRGLVSKCLHADPTSGAFVPGPAVAPKPLLMAMMKQLRAALKTRGYPTDEQVAWVQEFDKAWRPEEEADLQATERYERRSWYQQLCIMAPPVSNEFVQGKLLKTIGDVLDAHPSDFELERTVNLAFALAEFALATKGNPLFDQMMRECERRARRNPSYDTGRFTLRDGSARTTPNNELWTSRWPL